MNVAKLIKLPMLIDVAEMEELLHLFPYELYQVGRVISKGEERLDKGWFLQQYAHYIEGLKQGVERPFALSPALSVSGEALSFAAIDERVLVKPQLPLVQMQPHSIDASLRSMVFGTESISWGVQLTYPTLFQDPKTHLIEKVDERFVNTELFEKIRKWCRASTEAAGFTMQGKRVNVPIRLGKSCIGWINDHPGVKKWGLCVIN